MTVLNTTVSGVVIDAVYDAVLDALHDADVIGYAVVLPIVEDDITRARLRQSHLGQQRIDEVIICRLLALRFCGFSRIHRTFTLLVIIKYVVDATTRQ